MMEKKIKVLIIDDSKLIRRAVTEMLHSEPDIEIIGEAADAYEGRDKIVYLNPDVVILDIEMPRMDGLTFLEKLMKSKPMPVIIFSSLAKGRSKYEYKAYDLGAVGVVAKPAQQTNLAEIKDTIADLIRTSSRLSATQLRLLKNRRITAVQTPENPKDYLMSKPIIAIGASTGGTHAIRKIMAKLPEKFPPIVMVQHMPENFTTQFAARLNEISRLHVVEAQGGEQLVNGTAFLAPGGKHLEVIKKGAFYYTRVFDGPLVHHQKPAVEILFDSVAKYAKNDAVGIILTGMGADGAKGLLNMKNNGAHTIAQDEKSSIVFGMPKEAIKLQAAHKILDLKEIPAFLFRYLEGF